MNIPPILQSVEWTENPPQEPDSEGAPWATHSGVLEMFGHTLRCHRLSNGAAIIEADDMHEMLNAMAQDQPQAEREVG